VDVVTIVFYFSSIIHNPKVTSLLSKEIGGIKQFKNMFYNFLSWVLERDVLQHMVSVLNFFVANDCSLLHMIEFNLFGESKHVHQRMLAMTSSFPNIIVQDEH